MRAVHYALLALLATAGAAVAPGPPGEIPGPPEQAQIPGEFPGQGNFPGQAPDLPDQACDHIPDLTGPLSNVPDWVVVPGCSE